MGDLERQLADANEMLSTAEERWTKRLGEDREKDDNRRKLVAEQQQWAVDEMHKQHAEETSVLNRRIKNLEDDVQAKGDEIQELQVRVYSRAEASAPTLSEILGA